jgi:hypothetical protein
VAGTEKDIFASSPPPTFHVVVAIFSANVPKLVKYSPFRYVFKLELDQLLTCDVCHGWSPTDFALITFAWFPNTPIILNKFASGHVVASLPKHT